VREETLMAMMIPNKTEVLSFNIEEGPKLGFQHTVLLKKFR
jgi:hypothetical protein